jgi:GTPase SAR1 family protein
MLFSLWDFAGKKNKTKKLRKNKKIKKGHEEYHVSHSFFFQSGSVYLLLFDSSKQDIIRENKLLYWFHFLQTQIGYTCPVILIATKIDKIPFLKTKNSKADQINQSNK